MDGLFRAKGRIPLVGPGFSFSCVFRFFAFQLQFFATLPHLIGLIFGSGQHVVGSWQWAVGSGQQVVGSW